MPPIRLIELHENTPYHINRFGATFPERPVTQIPPQQIASNEAVYTEELLKAFSEKEETDITNNNISSYVRYEEELSSARKSFYSAESLERFSRDWLKNNSYEKLTEECHEAISPIVYDDHQNGYKRYLATLAHATSVNFSSHPLYSYIDIRDKKGICHQLVNLKKIWWVESG